MQALRAIVLAAVTLTVSMSGRAQEQVDWTRPIAFDQDGKRFDEVLKWLGAQSKLKVVSKAPQPTYPVTLSDSKNKSREYSLATIFDLLNQRLIAQEDLEMLRYDTTITIAPIRRAGDMEPLAIPRVRESELNDRPQTEMVEVLVKLPIRVDAEEFAPHARRLLGAVATVTVVPNNSLILQADVATLRKALPGIPIDWKSRVVFDQSGKPWPEVLQWLATRVRVGLVTLGNKPPNGKFVFVDPENKSGKPREYTLLQILDILNRDLQANHKLTILRSDLALTLESLPVKDIPGIWIRRVESDELDSYGETETVEMVIRLKSGQDAEEVAPHVKRLLGPFGVVTPIPTPNKLIIRGDVASVRRVLENLNQPSPPKKVERPEVDWVGKRYAFEAKDKPWDDMIRWLCTEAQLPWVQVGSGSAASVLPGRTFTFINPKDGRGNPRLYSLAEIYYILDDRLREEFERRILRTDICMLIWRLDREIPPHLKAVDPPRPATSEAQVHQSREICQPAPRCRPGLLGRLLRR